MGARSARFTYAPIHQWGIPPFALVRHGAVRPNNVPEKKKKVARARHGLRAPCQRIRVEFGAAGLGRWERVPRVLPMPPFTSGVYPPSTIYLLLRSIC